MSLNKNTKPVQIDTFESACDLKWLRCVSCGGHINRYKPAKVDPLTFGENSPKPKRQTHSCVISCKCGSTKVKAWGVAISHVIGPRSCFGHRVSLERVYDKPCYCREQKGSEPGHVHASQPAQEGSK